MPSLADARSSSALSSAFAAACFLSLDARARAWTTPSSARSRGVAETGQRLAQDYVCWGAHFLEEPADHALVDDLPGAARRIAELHHRGTNGRRESA